MIEEARVTEAPEAQPTMPMSFAERVECAIALMRGCGVDMQVAPIDMGAYSIQPKISMIDLWKRTEQERP